ncbi:MAG: hypothetical protein Q4F01_09600 [Staphylococcus rostri]|uniref:hypothetical protein n=1 Tax=Staphylococcus rostri TaxID=522262 RepID=UPI0026E09AF9|nr:hypothetical protein [Staphylococcus rostri]MDO5376418.1 hypothetical protein [Staphylococcus rostri]
MNKLKLTKYQVVLTILLFVCYSITVQIASKSILQDEVTTMPKELTMNPDVALFWLNIAIIISSIILVVIQALIYKMIVGWLGVKREMSFGFSLLLWVSAVLTSGVITVLGTLLNDGMSVSQNAWFGLFTVVLSATVYGLLLWYFDVLEKQKAILVIIIISVLGNFGNLIKFV